MVGDRTINSNYGRGNTMIYYDEDDVVRTNKHFLFTIVVCMLAGFGLGLVVAGLAISMYGKGWF